MKRIKLLIRLIVLTYKVIAHTKKKIKPIVIIMTAITSKITYISDLNTLYVNLLL